MHSHKEVKHFSLQYIQTICRSWILRDSQGCRVCELLTKLEVYYILFVGLLFSLREGNGQRYIARRIGMFPLFSLINALFLRKNCIFAFIKIEIT